MYAVFYDLETTDKNCVGQIINYSFILVDEALKPVDELSELVYISRLQLPDSGAILANRTDVLEHQKRAQFNEYEAMHRIDAFLRKCIDRSGGALAFVGYNSARFDLQYLRTSLIRNGLDPYYGKSLHYRDLLHVVQKAYLSSSDFRELIRRERGEEKKLSLSLQTTARALGLLSGAQAHESREDVLLTIDVAATIKERFGIDIASFRCYEGLNLHATSKTGAVYVAESPEYDLTASEFSVKTPMTLLDFDHRSSLWINLSRYMEKPDGGPIVYRNFSTGPLFISHNAVRDPQLERAARSAIAQYKNVTVRSFFERSTCDIEMDIYRLDAADRECLKLALAKGSKAPLEKCSSEDTKKLWVRSELARVKDLSSNPKASEMLAKYAVYRYGGALQIARRVREKSDGDDRRGDGDFHPTLHEMVRELERAKEHAQAAGNSDDCKLLGSLEAFYRSSDILKVAGAELLPC